MIGLLRTPERNSRSCSAMYTALCPASRGHSALVLLPFGPWQEEHTAALVAPLVALPWVKGSSGVDGGAAFEFAAGALGAAAVDTGGALVGACASAQAALHNSTPVRAARCHTASLRLCVMIFPRLFP